MATNNAAIEQIDPEGTVCVFMEPQKATFTITSVVDVTVAKQLEIIQVKMEEEASKGSNKLEINGNEHFNGGELHDFTKTTLGKIGVQIRPAPGKLYTLSW